MELMTYKTRAVRTLSLLILVALLAALNPPSLTDSSAFAQTATAPELDSSADTANQVDLSWTEVTGADDYELWRWETSEGWVEVDDSIEGTSYSDTGVTAGNTYYYQVSADGGSTWSNRVNETVGAYDASTLAAPTVTSSSVSLSWGAVTGATSYALWRFETSWAQVGGALTGTSYTDNSVEIGKTYYYQVMANGPNGDGAWSNRVEAVVPTTTPGAPLNFTATPGDAQVSLSWDPPTSDGGEALTGYQYRYQAVGGTWSGWMDTAPALSRTATVTGLANETNHNFEVQAVNTNGAGATAADSAMPMSTVPATPSGLGTTSTGPTEITLSWSAVTGAASYQLQRRTNGGAWGSPMDAGSGTTYTDTGLDPSTTYDYEVRSVNTAGSSGWSGVVTASTTAATAPDAVSDLAASAGASSITLSWSAPDSNGADITGYTIEVSDDGSTGWTDLASKAAGDTSHEHTNLGPGTTKHYRITATNSVGTSLPSATAMATVAAVEPGKPTLYATASGTTITLTWVAPAATGGADITGYTIQVSNNGTTGWGNLASKAAGDTSHDHTGLTAGTTRYYRISARNSVGSGDWSDVASATIGGADPPPFTGHDNSSPRSLTVSQVAVGTARGTDTASLTVSWVVPSDPPDADSDPATLTGYEAQVWNPATQTWGTVMNATSETDATPVAAPITVNAGVGGSLTDTGLMGTTEYTYRVRAVDGTGSSAVRGAWTRLNDAASGTTVAVSPSQPTLTATAMGTDKIVLTWSVPDDGGSDIVGYILQVGPNSGALGEWLDNDGTAVTAAFMLDPAQQSVTHKMNSGTPPTPLTAGTERVYQITAVNGVVTPTDFATANAAWSDASAEATATTATGVPGAPSDITFTATAVQVDGTVVASDNTGGTGVAFTSHEIQQYDAENDSWTILQDNLTLTFQVTGLDANEELYFRARSKNTHGASGWTTRSVTTAEGLPSAVKLTATVNGSSDVTLSWTVPENDGGTDSGVNGYVIQRSLDFHTAATATWLDATGEPAAAELGGIGASTLSKTHTSGLTAGTTISYRVRATNGNTNTPADSDWSNVVTVTTATGGVPGAPTWDTTDALTPSAGPTITINWVAPASNGGSPITGYDIAMWEDGQWMIIASNISPTPVQYAHSEGLSGATTYYFSVRARNANGAGSWSTVESDETPAGSAGKPALTATPDGDKQIVLSWTEPDSGGGTITDYLVQVSNNGTIGWAAFDPTDTDNIVNVGGDTYTRVATPEGAPAPPLTVTHSGLTGLTKKYYRVRAATATATTPVTDAGSHGAWSDVMHATTPAGKPGAPTWPDADNTAPPDAFTVTASSITVAWEAPANGGSAITRYQIQVWDDGAWMDLMSVGGSVTSYMHSGLPGATTRYYRVRATNAVGDSGWSATHSGTTADGMPGAPVLHADQNGSTQIRLTWTAPATGAAAESVVISNFQIQVSSDGQSGWTTPDAAPATPLNNTISGGERVLQTAAAASTTADSTRNYTDSGLDPAMTMHYRVRAVNSNQVVGPWSTKAMASTLGGRPGRPVLTATASGTSIINLVWTPPTGDGGSAVTGYELQYWDGSNGWMDLVALDDSVTAYTHRNIVGGVTKFYRIRAENAAGTGNWSTTAYATTATTAPLPPTLVAAADGATMIKLTWTAGHDGGLAITAYHLQESSNAGGTWADVDDDIAPGMTMSHTDTGLTGGTTKHYRIRAENSKGDGGWSPLASATTDNSVPGKPTLSVNGLTKAAYVSWASPATPDGGLTITSYEVQRWDAANRRWVDRLTTSTTAFLDSGLTTGKNYFYRVRARNSMGFGDWSTFAGDEVE